MTSIDGRVFAFVYAAVGLAAVMIIAFLMPPHMNPDEPAHFNRADQIGRGGIIAKRLNERLAGGKVNNEINASMRPMKQIVGHSEQMVTPAMLAAAGSPTWSNSGTGPQSFGNTAVYPPLFYLPSTLGIRIGRVLDLSIVDTLYISRMLTGVVAVAIGTLALALAGSTAAWLYAMLMVPTTLSLSASVSQEALMHGFAALGCAFAARSFLGLGSGRINLFGAAISIALVVMARPPLIGLALVPLAMWRLTWRERLIGTAIIVLSTTAWLLLTIRAFVHPRLGLDRSASPAEFGTAGQIGFMLRHPTDTANAVIKTMYLHGASVYEGFLGGLGWNDVVFPSWYFGILNVMLAVAFLASASRQPVKLFGAGLIALALFGIVVAIYVSQYVAWSPIGSDTIEGVQGRYFVVPALFLGLLCPAFRLPAMGQRALASTALAFPIVVTLPVTILVLVHRYYLG